MFDAESCNPTCSKHFENVHNFFSSWKRLKISCLMQKLWTWIFPLSKVLNSPHSEHLHLGIFHIFSPLNIMFVAKIELNFPFVKSFRPSPSSKHSDASSHSNSSSSSVFLQFVFGPQVLTFRIGRLSRFNNDVTKQHTYYMHVHEHVMNFSQCL